METEASKQLLVGVRGE